MRSWEVDSNYMGMCSEIRDYRLLVWNMSMVETAWRNRRRNDRWGASVTHY